MRAFLDNNLLSLMLYSCFSSAMSSSLYSSSCKLQEQFDLNGMHKTGDVIIGGLFAINFFSDDLDVTFTSKPQLPPCYG